MKLPADKQPILRVATRSMDANPNGDIFGGWLMAQLDIAGSIPAAKLAKGRVATVAVNRIQFIQPLFVHDLVSIYAEIVKIGTSSIAFDLEVYAERARLGQTQILKIADAQIVYVALDEKGNKKELPS